MKTAVAVLATCLAATGLLSCGGSSNDDRDTSSPLSLPRVMTEAEMEDFDGCLDVCKGTPNLPPGITVVPVAEVSEEVVDRCEKILPCRALRKGNH